MGQDQMDDAEDERVLVDWLAKKKDDEDVRISGRLIGDFLWLDVEQGNPHTDIVLTEQIDGVQSKNKVRMNLSDAKILADYIYAHLKAETVYTFKH